MNRMTYIIIMILFAPSSQVFAQISCLRPVPPWIPSNDNDIREYADIIADDFEKYFSDLTAYFRCVDRERDAVFSESRRVGEQAQNFWLRVKELGVESKVQ